MISFESPDGQGKTTHTKRLLSHLEKLGFRAIYIKSPDSKSIFFKKIYSTLESGWAVKNPLLFQAMQFLNKLHFQHFFLPKLRREMDVIIMDRWDVSMQAYGFATGVPLSIIRTMSKMLVKPDQVFLMSGNPTSRKVPRDMYESNSALQKAVSEFYNSHEWRSDYNEITEIKVSENPDDTFKNILEEFIF